MAKARDSFAQAARSVGALEQAPSLIGAAGEMAMQEYQLRLENLKGEPIFIYQFLSPDDVSAIARIATIKNIPYQRYEVWRGLNEKIAEGPRFVSRERFFFDMPWAAR